MSCTVVAISQCLERGDSDSFDIIIPNRDLTGAPNTTIWFTAKQNKTLTTQREISRSNKDITYPLVIAYNNPDTTITVPIIPADTQDLQVTSLVAGVQLNNDLDSDDIETLADGTLTIQFDVRTIFDEYPLPDTASTYQQVDASDFEVDSLMWVQEVNGIRVMEEITIAELKTELGI